MKFGILLSHQYRRTDDLRQRIDEIWRLADLAEETGFDAIHGLNHFLSDLATLQPISLLGALTQRTTQLRLGVTVLLLPMYHPVQIAEEFATLDHLSNGRVMLGVGIGYRDAEYEAFGIERRNRAPMFEEYIEAIRLLWSDEPVEMDGKYVQLSGDRIGIPPLRAGGPPLWIGGGAKPAVRRAARLGDAWVATGGSSSPTYLERYAAIHDEALVAAGKRRDGREYPVLFEMFCGPDDATARSEAEPYLRNEYEAYAPHRKSEWKRDDFRQLMDQTWMVGSPEYLVTRIKQVETLGFNHMIFRSPQMGMPFEVVERSLRRFAAEVMPAFENA